MSDPITAAAVGAAISGGTSLAKGKSFGSSLQNAVFNNAYGIPKGKLGSELLNETTNQLKELYPHVEQIEGEKVLRIEKQTSGFLIETNKNKYTSKIIIIGIGAGNQVDGQVLVLHDMLGMSKEFSPRFLRRYLDLNTSISEAVQFYTTDVKKGDFPNEKEQY